MSSEPGIHVKLADSPDGTTTTASNPFLVRYLCHAKVDPIASESGLKCVVITTCWPGTNAARSAEIEDIWLGKAPMIWAFAKLKINLSKSRK